MMRMLWEKEVSTSSNDMIDDDDDVYYSNKVLKDCKFTFLKTFYSTFVIPSNDG